MTFSPDLTKVEFVAHQVAAAEELRKAIEFGLYLIFLDETAFTRNDGKAYGYGPKGKRVVFQHHKPTYTIGGIAASSQFRLEGFQLRDGKTNKLAFTHFVISLIKRLREEGAVPLERVVFYLDNATYHTSPDILELFRLIGVSYIFAPAYLSPVNPIEYFFGNVKKLLRQQNLVTK